MSDPFNDDFRAKAFRDPVIRALTDMIERELHACRITTDDAVRIGVLAAQEYFMRCNVPMRITIEETR